MSVIRKIVPVAVAMVLAVLFGGTALRAQQPAAQASEAAPPVQQNVETAIIPVSNADVKEVAELLYAFRNALGGQIRPNAELKVIAVSGSKELVEACKEAVRRLDVPPPPSRSLELTFTVLIASKAGDGQRDIPADLQGVVEQLKKLAAFKSFRMADVQAVRVKDGSRAEVGGTIPSLGPTVAQIPYTIMFNSADRVASDKEVRVRLRNLMMEARVEVRSEKSSSNSSPTLKTDVEFAVGQKAVIGTTGVMGTDDSLILVVSARDAD